MEEERTQRVYLFDGSNFSNWSYRMEAYLEELGLAHCIQRSLEEEEFFEDLDEDTVPMKVEKARKRDQRKQQDAKCKSILIHKVADSHLDFIKGKTTPKEIWDTLGRLFEKKGVAGIFYLLKQMSVAKYDESRPLEEHIVAFEKIVRDLESAGVKFDEKVIVFNLLQSMPKSYEQLITVLETLPAEQCSLEFVKTRLLSEGVKRQLGGMTSESSTAFAGRSKPFKFACHGCGKVGHRKTDCPERRQEPGNQGTKAKKWNPKQSKPGNGKANSAETDDVAFLTADGAVENFHWVLDSGASEHMVNNKKYLNNVYKLEQPVVICVAKSREQLVSHYAGEVRMLATVGERKFRCVVYEVLYVPNLTMNLFSVKRIGERGMSVTFTRTNAFIAKEDGTRVCEATRKSKLFELNVELVRPPEASALIVDHSMQMTRWHRRFGHIGNSGLTKLVRCRMVEGLELGGLKVNEECCESCMKGKQARLPFDSSSKTRSSRPLELVHTDVCGPFTPAAWNGGKMFVTFIDDFTHFTAVYVLKAKSEVYDVFKKYSAMAETHFERKISRIRCDNGGEYVNEAFQAHCNEAGIMMETTAPYTPQQNGVAERMNRTIMERARAILDDSGFKRHMWNEAVQTAVYLINRSPTAALTEPVTPYEKWFGHKPNVSRLRIFGSRAFVHVPKEKRSKLDDKSKLVYFIGYGVNGYRLWDPVKRNVFVSRDVIVDESAPKRTPTCFGSNGKGRSRR